MNIVEHRVRSVDTIQSIAVTYLNNADRWRDLVAFNNLDYPYVSADPLFEPYVKASGKVQVTRQYIVSALTVPEGTKFAVPAADGLPARIYESLLPVTIPAGQSTASIPVQCTIAGLWGNVPGNTITAIIAEDYLQNAFSSITNPDAFSNGNILNVKTLGDAILIPVDDTWDGDTAYESVDDFYNRFFGEDIELGDDGDFTFDGYGALGSVIGVGNLGQAVRDRLVTPKLSLVYHPEYGSVLGNITAQAPAPYTEKWISLAIIETLLADDRIGNAQVVSLTRAGRELRVVVEVTPINQGESFRVPATLANLPIAA